MSSSTSLISSPTRMLMVGSYIVDKKIGVGSFSVVFRAHHHVTHQTVAIKSITRSKINVNDKLKSNLEREIEVMKSMEHSNILRLIEVINTEKHIYLILEYCNHGDLHHLIQRHKSRGMDLQLIRELATQLLSGLEYLSSRNLVHRDVKPHNLLLHTVVSEGGEERLELKFADFGFARALAPEEMTKSMCCSPLYAAPELLSGSTYDARVDLWSAGIVLYEMLTGEVPFRASNHVQLVQRIQRDPTLHFPGHTATTPSSQQQQHLQQLIRSLVQLNPQARSDASKLKSHLFFHNNNHLSSNNESTVAAVNTLLLLSQEQLQPAYMLLDTLLLHDIINTYDMYLLLVQQILQSSILHQTLQTKEQQLIMQRFHNMIVLQKNDSLTTTTWDCFVFISDLLIQSAEQETLHCYEQAWNLLQQIHIVLTLVFKEERYGEKNMEYQQWNDYILQRIHECEICLNKQTQC